MQIQAHSCIGGKSIGDDIRKLDHGVHIVSGTPGRVFDMIRRRNLRTRNIKTLILDEADEMLNQVCVCMFVLQHTQRDRNGYCVRARTRVYLHLRMLTCSVCVYTWDVHLSPQIRTSVHDHLMQIADLFLFVAVRAPLHCMVVQDCLFPRTVLFMCLSCKL